MTCPLLWNSIAAHSIVSKKLSPQPRPLATTRRDKVVIKSIANSGRWQPRTWSFHFITGIIYQGRRTKSRNTIRHRHFWFVEWNGMERSSSHPTKRTGCAGKPVTSSQHGPSRQKDRTRLAREFILFRSPSIMMDVMDRASHMMLSLYYYVLIFFWKYTTRGKSKIK